MGLGLLFQLWCSVRSQWLPERLVVLAQDQTPARCGRQSSLGLGARWCAGSTCSGWSPEFETDSPCSLERPCNPSAFIFPSARWETQFLANKCYLWVTGDTRSKVQGRKQRQEIKIYRCLCQYRHRLQRGRKRVTLVRLPVSYFYLQGDENDVSSWMGKRPKH